MPKKKRKVTVGDPVAIYARYSSHNQKDASIEQQVAEARRYAAELGLVVVEVYADHALSGKTDRRPAFQRMLRDAKLGRFRALIAWKSSRLGRNMLQAMQNEQLLADYGITVLYSEEDFDDTAAGRFAARSMMSVNQFYVENMAEDIRRGMADNAQRCLVNGNFPLGYRAAPDHRYEIDEPAAAIVREVYQRFLSGEPRSEIAADLNRRGVKTGRGSAWNKNSFRSILTNERYTGVYIYDDVRIDGGMPQIIDRATFARTQEALMQKRQSQGRRSKTGANYLLTGKLFCGACKSPMVGVSGTSKTGVLHYYYCCNGKRLGKNGCKKKNVRKDVIEKLVAEKLFRCLQAPDVVNYIVEQALDYSRRELAQSDVSLLEQQLAQTETALKNLLSAIEQGIVTVTTRARLLELEKEQARLSAKLDSARAALIHITRADVLAWLSLIQTGDLQDEQFQAALFQTFLKAVYVYDDRLVLLCNFLGDENEIPLSELSGLADLADLSDLSDLLDLLPPDAADLSDSSGLFRAPVTAADHGLSNSSDIPPAPSPTLPKSSYKLPTGSPKSSREAAFLRARWRFEDLQLSSNVRFFEKLLDFSVPLGVYY